MRAVTGSQFFGKGTGVWHCALDSILVGDGGDNLGDEVAVFGLVFFAEGGPADEIVEEVPGIGAGVCVVFVGVGCRGFGEGKEVFFSFIG